jgi:hypothetical protein
MPAGLAGRSFYVMDFANKRAWRFSPSHAWLVKHDPGHAVSIGFVLGEDISQAQLDAFLRRGTARVVDYDHANHGGCLSSCVRRGGQKCQW